MSMKSDKAYLAYVKAREKAWKVHDQLVREGKFFKNHPLYIKACKVEHDKYVAYLNADDASLTGIKKNVHSA